MPDPNANANAASIADKLDGRINGQPLDYCLVTLLHKSGIFSLRDGSFPQPEGENTSPSRLDQITTLAKILSRTYVASDGHEYDIWDAVMTVLESVLSNPKAV